jgi:hypothetical protein
MFISELYAQASQSVYEFEAIDPRLTIYKKPPNFGCFALLERSHTTPGNPFNGANGSPQ